MELNCPSCGADADEVDSSWAHGSADEIDAPVSFSKYATTTYLFNLLPRTARWMVSAVMIALLVAYLLWLKFG